MMDAQIVRGFKEMESEFGYIYIGVYASDLSKCKIGKSTIGPFTRFIQKTNAPDYMPFRAYKIPLSDLHKLEQYLHKKLAFHSQRILHTYTGSESEWFSCHPLEAADIIEYLIPNCLDIETNEYGFELRGIVIYPPYHENIFSYWREEHVPFLKLFVDDFGRVLPQPTFRPWKEI
ncbi:GIY-YIG nuclease family protein [Enterobacter roggenkampii]|uniref:GIY-YIG nuclease family protein n=1 Tax=Enterobacteriaceae TaxID=543 RepID=UPI002ABA0DE6|nr:MULTISPECIES: GIY-YIG nuclease family protein [Enterobacteriaceae]MDZ4033885.1 GIY-YIG nuclease family protein [Kluyvera ascorbata]MEB6511455.1 GIY-YIG nuclease family protein [Enterobacter roggenkampii]